MHVPHGFPPEFKDSSTSKTIYGDTLRELDHTKGDLGGSQGPFKGSWQKTHGGGGATGKFTTWEAGHHEPGVFYWKGKISPGVTDALGSTLDLMPTLAALAGASLPSGRSWDGLDLAPVLFE